ncbi:MAG: hypothetical protein COV44_04885 [Deltaproteobacteria bacterium CG11_big_fil_rev_8_21_14_0_20_45_16]|nr:MAG: hypothetical protein COV44_04885 [Deltaproteobacteria bacterium CG11_big_fil_rev_8_21_14_0_20_45_16]
MKSKLLLFLIFCPFSLSFVYANEFDFNNSSLTAIKTGNRDTYEKIMNYTMEALQFSLHRPLNRSKLPGPYKLFFETEGDIFDLNDSQVALATSDRFAPDSLKSISLKAGAGFPYGFYLDGGFSYILNSLSASSVFGNLGFQILDFANIVYTDMIPAVSVNVGANYIVDGPAMYGLTSSLLIGAYHRLLWAQISYIFQVSYTQLTDTNPSESHIFIRNGVSSYWPLFEGLFVQQTLYIEPIEANVGIGYQF